VPKTVPGHCAYLMEIVLYALAILQIVTCEPGGKWITAYYFKCSPGAGEIRGENVHIDGSDAVVFM
jgi:hypothetical protein